MISSWLGSTFDGRRAGGDGRVERRLDVLTGGRALSRRRAGDRRPFGRASEVTTGRGARARVERDHVAVEVVGDAERRRRAARRPASHVTSPPRSVAAPASSGWPCCAARVVRVRPFVGVTTVHCVAVGHDSAIGARPWATCTGAPAFEVVRVVGVARPLTSRAVHSVAVGHCTCAATGPSTCRSAAPVDHFSGAAEAAVVASSASAQTAPASAIARPRGDAPGPAASHKLPNPIIPVSAPRSSSGLAHH